MENHTCEFSSGGIILENDKVLLIYVENLSGTKVWTFPKGHIEKGETCTQAALREVVEEAGYECEILEEIDNIEYFFNHKEKRIKKNVKWFLMKPLAKIKEPDNEVLAVKWLDVEEADKLLGYESDKELLKKACKALEK
ncbi:MAG: hypothetical protein A2252_05200 [Elusimicrobia bacterium RIFOXYA2_FULL_39_19]|nr:MAG: hypothetical protein A2252_05200 [Elusimicrobia bacterium RIFOXYA2_FULL_39_19]